MMITMPDAKDSPSCNISLNYELLGWDQLSPAPTLSVTLDVYVQTIFTYY